MMMYGDSALEVELEDLTDEFAAECAASAINHHHEPYSGDMQVAGLSYVDPQPMDMALDNSYGYIDQMGSGMYIHDNNYSGLQSNQMENSMDHQKYNYDNSIVMCSQPQQGYMMPNNVDNMNIDGMSNMNNINMNSMNSTSYEPYMPENPPHVIQKIQLVSYPQHAIDAQKKNVFKRVSIPSAPSQVVYVQPKPGLPPKQVRLIPRSQNVSSHMGNNMYKNSYQRIHSPETEVLTSTPEAISRMVDHGDYVRPSHHIQPSTSLNTFEQPVYRFYSNHNTVPQSGSAHCAAVNIPNVASNAISSNNSVKPLNLTIPKKKKPENVALSATELAQAAALQRIGTEEGWKQMNNWLKQAEKEKKNVHLKDLLRQCLQAKVSVDLLMSNDTPKFVRRLSKEHSDSDIKKLASNCVSKWKQEVANPEVPKKEKKKKVVPVVQEYDDNDDDKLDESMASPMKNERKTEKRRSSDSDDGKLKNKEKKNKVKAKVYTAKSRLTGLEEPDDAKPPEAKRKRDSTDAVKKVEEVKPKKAAPVVKKVSATLSSGFMDALSVSSEPKKRVVPKKKTPAPVEKKEQYDPSATPTVLDGIFDQPKLADTAKPSKPVASSPPMPVASAPPVSTFIDTDEPDFVPAARRKIRFADEIGKELVLIKEFEIEEGERINVNHMTPEDMRQHELVMERRYKGEQKIEEDEEEKEKNNIRWRLIRVDGTFTDFVRGAKSEAKLIEEERQRHAMRAFNDPSMPSEITEIDLEDFDPIAASRHIPKIIPLELEEPQKPPAQASVPVASAAAAAAAKAVLPDNLQNLLDGLKKKGIVGEGPTNSFAALVPPFGLMPNSNTSSAPSHVPPPKPISTISQGMMRPQSSQPIQSFPPSHSSYGQHNMHPPHNAPNHQGPPHHLPQQPSVSQSRNPHSHIDNSPAMPATPVQRMPIIPGGNTNHNHGPPARPCQFFKSPRGCHFGNRCKFAHGDRDRDHSSGNSYGGNSRSGYYQQRGSGYSNRGIRNGPVYSNPRHHHNDYDHHRYEHHRDSHSPPNSHIRSPDHIQSPLQSPNSFSKYDSITRIPSEPVDSRIESPTSPT
ncbi:unnamed protein product [Auanema sp. JU1783]|nr:unnamed protein product [Auanema sp. JU1783]